MKYLHKYPEIRIIRMLYYPMCIKIIMWLDISKTKYLSNLEIIWMEWTSHLSKDAIRLSTRFWCSLCFRGSSENDSEVVIVSTWSHRKTKVSNFIFEELFYCITTWLFWWHVNHISSDGENLRLVYRLILQSLGNSFPQILLEQ